ncbi:endonuclease/exonuclease/phosphatase family protein [Dyadobacter pollutisoli]|uniref:Endonuclease/exonuclease/phosphatase family protein n=1 Tax=Dyadobacter pollutisoli TaxID=2910158 RepID=A0A9E8SIY4_9BACT|nr:endonuclease/exonuclease/phosphatase family protein [Dyadobacter pollutisoli]WAC09614.1 endonuclease/exonuclease/phosphatase family protein [Dyadobacter pollutisoli]
MKNTLLSVLALISFSVFANTGTDQPVKKFRFKVMTYNIHHCNPPSAGDKIDVEAIAKVVNAEKPDFVALQEVDVNTERSGKGKNQAQQLAALTGMKFYFSKAIDHQGGDYGVAVLSKYAIIDSARASLPIHADKPEENRTIAAITVTLPSKQKIIFASTHLGLKEPNRLLQAEKIMESFGKNELPMILAGDFNAVPESPVIAYFDKYFTRTCSDCKPTIPVEAPNKTIDFIMAKKGSKLKGGETRVIDEKYASDHLPVVAEFTLE